jgi:DNA-binding transcriptional LysR family regulator
MNLRALRTLAAIDDLGSFQRVAEHLHMTLSSVSMQMKGLEAELGAPLFDRAFRPPRLTPLGREVAQAARGILSESDRIAALAGDPGALAGSYRIGFVLTASVRLLPPMLLRARKRHPAARFAIETGLSETLMRRVLHGDLDAAVVTRPGEPRALLHEVTLRTEELVYALSASAAAMSTEAAMAQLTFIQFTPETGIGRLIADHVATRFGGPARGIVLDGIEAVMECVRLGVGFTALPEPDVRRYAAAGVVVRPLGEPPITRDLTLVTFRDSHIRAQLDALVALFRDD